MAEEKLVTLWSSGPNASDDEIRLVQAKQTDRTTGYLLRVSKNERFDRDFVKGIGWCMILLRLPNARQISRLKRILGWVYKERGRTLLMRLNKDAWDMVSVLIGDKEYRESPVRGIIERYGRAISSN